MRAGTFRPAARAPWRPDPAWMMPAMEPACPPPSRQERIRQGQAWQEPDSQKPTPACPAVRMKMREPAMARMPTTRRGTTRMGMRVAPSPRHQDRLAWARHSHRRPRARTESWRPAPAWLAMSRAVASPARSRMPGTGWAWRTGPWGRQARVRASAPPLLLSLPCGPARMPQGWTRQGEQQWGPSSYWSGCPVDALPATGRESLMTRARPTQRQRKPPPDATGPNRP